MWWERRKRGSALCMGKKGARWRDARCSFHTRLENNTINHSQLLSYRIVYFSCCSLSQILMRSLDCRPRFTIPSNSHYHDDQTFVLNRAHRNASRLQTRPHAKIWFGDAIVFQLERTNGGRCGRSGAEQAVDGRRK